MKETTLDDTAKEKEKKFYVVRDLNVKHLFFTFCHAIKYNLFYLHRYLSLAKTLLSLYVTLVT